MNHKQITAQKKAGDILGRGLEATLFQIKPGITEIALNDFFEEYITKRGGFPGFKKVPGYKHAICVATNDVVVHGIPGKRVLKENDIICIDAGVYMDGYHTDMGETVKVLSSKLKIKSSDDEIDKFLRVGKQTMFAAIAQARIGNRTGHISKVIQEGVEGKGYSVVRSLIGHGVGKTLHEKPEIPGVLHGKIESTAEITLGMTLAIEVIYAKGQPDVVYGDDGWTIKTKDGSISAVFERTVLVTKNGPEIITRMSSDSDLEARLVTPIAKPV